MCQLGEGVVLVHKLGQRRGTEEFLDRRGHGADGHVDGACGCRAADGVGVRAIADGHVPYDTGDIAGIRAVLKVDGQDGELVLKRQRGQVVAVPCARLRGEVIFAAEVCERAFLRVEFGIIHIG